MFLGDPVDILNFVVFLGILNVSISNLALDTNCIFKILIANRAAAEVQSDFIADSQFYSNSPIDHNSSANSFLS